MELIFEIGCEDLPARFVDPALEQLEETFREECDDRRIGLDGLRTVGTPRRLTLLVDELADEQRSITRTTEGPPAEVGVDDDGGWTAASGSFAESQGGTTDDLFVNNDERVAIEVELSGEPTSELLPSILDTTLRSLEFPKSMRWAAYDERFGRPVRWLVAVAGGEVVPVEFAGAESSAETRGHRFAAPGALEVRSVDEYLGQLREAHVVVDPDERRARIEESLEEMADEVGGRVVDDPGLVDEVVHLVEEPHPTRLDFSEEYLELPDEVLVESMRSHQRYFAIESGESGELLPHCGVIYNTPVEDPEVVNEGNLRVLRARLDDGMFFWNKDLEGDPDDRRDDLSEVVWIEQIGTMYDRTDRIAGTARQIAELVGLDDETAAHAERAGELSKSDLVTEMVDEFPKLQGVMGREYARRAGEPEEVAVAIHEQYLPRGAGDDLPATDAGACVALAEKLDALVGCFGVGMEPTASSDPYGLRRAALGVIRILEDRQFTVGLEALVGAAERAYTRQGTELQAETVELANDLEEFIMRRLQYHLEEDYPTDVVRAVFAADVESVVGIRGRVRALADMRGEADFEPLAHGFKRVVNILEGAERSPEHDDVAPAQFRDDAERELYESCRAIRERVSEAVDGRNWSEACDALVELKGPIDAFFESVRVEADDESVRRNRFALLETVRTLFFEIGDISRIQV